MNDENDEFNTIQAIFLHLRIIFEHKNIDPYAYMSALISEALIMANQLNVPLVQMKQIFEVGLKEYYLVEKIMKRKD